MSSSTSSSSGSISVSPSSSSSSLQHFLNSIESILKNSDDLCKFIRRLLCCLILCNTKNENGSSNKLQCKYFAFNIFDSIFPSDENSEAIIKMLQNIIDTFHIIDEDYLLPDDIMDNAIYEHTIDIIDKLLKNIKKVDKLKSKFDKFRNILQLQLTVDKERLLASSLSSLSSSIQKSQNRFEKPIDNSYENPFKPSLTEKPFAQKSLKIEECPIINIDPKIISPKTYYSHPYEIELRRLIYPEWQLADPNLGKIIVPNVLPYEYIDTVEALQNVLEVIQECREIAIDVQNHFYRSFQGFICILQLATRDNVYIIDTITLRSKMNLLAPILGIIIIITMTDYYDYYDYNFSESIHY
jgi:hypothetical protein